MAKDNGKSFSIPAFLGGLVVGNVISTIVSYGATNANLSPLMLVLGTFLTTALIVFFAIYLMSDAISRKEYLLKSFAIGILGLIGFVAEYFLKDVTTTDGEKYKIAFVKAFVSSTLLLFGFGIFLGLLFVH